MISADNLKIGFIVWNPFMVYHMKSIAEKLKNSHFLVLDYQKNIKVLNLFGDNPNEFFNAEYHVIKPKDFKELDGIYDAVICPNPFPGIEFLNRTKCIGMQYSMAKDRYVNGAWRAMFDMTMTYGKYSAERINHFCSVSMVGNPRFEKWFSENTAHQIEDYSIPLDVNKATLLYLPTWGEFSSVDRFLDSIKELSDEYNVLIKMHHKTDTHESARKKDITARKFLRFFGAMDDLLPLLKYTDIILSDYSGAIFDAIYVKKPVILLQEDPQSLVGKKFGFESIEFSQRDSIGPVVHSPSELRSIVKKVKNKEIDFTNLNAELRKDIFEYDKDTGLIASKAIIDFINNPPERPLHQIYIGNELKAERLRRRKVKNNFKRIIKKVLGIYRKF